MKRRAFLKQTAATAVGAATFTAGVAPTLLFAKDNSKRKYPVIGQGEYQYECLHNWGQLPDTMPSPRSTVGWRTDFPGLRSDVRCSSCRRRTESRR